MNVILTFNHLGKTFRGLVIDVLQIQQTCHSGVNYRNYQRTFDVKIHFVVYCFS